ncbi:MAG: DUF1016 family protein [Candidatus Omnitrophica bacterium]|nr:DUF1016 family protein [Candidatus Omnitrophota bacterium]
MTLTKNPPARIGTVPAAANASYQRLVKEIGGLYENARRALVQSYWQIEKRIVEVEQAGAVKAAYGSGLLPKLSRNLSQQYGAGFSIENLYRTKCLYRTKGTRSHYLIWYLLLLGKGKTNEPLISDS